MLTKSVASALGAACWLLAGLHGAAAQGAAPKTDLNFCNNTGAKVFIALVYYQTQTSKWILSAWHTRNPGECKSLGTYRPGITYYYAEKEGRTAHWPSAANIDKTFCVPPGRVERTQLGGTCAQGERNVGFHGINATGASYKFNLSN